MRSSLTAAALALGLVLSSTVFSRLLTARADELLSNGGFEDGTTGWAAAGGNLTIITAPTHGGSQAGSFEADMAGAGIVQRGLVPVQPNGTYTLTAFILKNDQRVDAVEARITWQDEYGGNAGSKRSTKLTNDLEDWQPVSITAAESPPNAVTAQIAFYATFNSAGGQVHIDDVSFDGPPPPTPAPASPTPTPTVTAAATPQPTSTQAPTTTPAPSSTPTAIPTPTPPGMPTGALLNGGFEDAWEGTLVGWKKHGGTLQQTATHRRSGSYAAAFISDTDSTKWVYQPVRVQPDRTYVFEGYVLLNDPGVKEAFLRVSWYASDNTSGTAIASFDSTERLSGSDLSFRHLTTAPLLVPVGVRSAQVKVMLVPVSSTRATIYLDDMNLYEAPPETPISPTAPPSPISDVAPLEQNEPGPGGPAAGSGRLSETLSQAIAAAESPHQVKINEVLYDPARSGDDAGYEWIELYNAGAEPVELANWAISDNQTSDPLPPLSLSPGAFAVVAAGEEFRSAYPAFSGSLIVIDDGKIGNGLANKGDRLLLRDASGKLADAVSYGEDDEALTPPVPTVAPGHSLERSPPGQDTDSAQDFVDNPRPSPGMGIKEAAVLAGTTSRSKDSSSAKMSIDASQGSDPSGIGMWMWVIMGVGLFAVGTGLGTATALLRRRVRR